MRETFHESGREKNETQVTVSIDHPSSGPPPIAPRVLADAVRAHRRVEIALASHIATQQSEISRVRRQFFCRPAAASCRAGERDELEQARRTQHLTHHRKAAAAKDGLKLQITGVVLPRCGEHLGRQQLHPAWIAPDQRLGETNSCSMAACTISIGSLGHAKTFAMSRTGTSREYRKRNHQNSTLSEAP